MGVGWWAIRLDQTKFVSGNKNTQVWQKPARVTLCHWVCELVLDGGNIKIVGRRNTETYCDVYIIVHRQMPHLLRTPTRALHWVLPKMGLKSNTCSKPSLWSHMTWACVQLCMRFNLASLYNPNLLWIIHELVIGEAVGGASFKRIIFSTSSPPLVPTSYSIRMIICTRFWQQKRRRRHAINLLALLVQNYKYWRTHLACQ